MPIVDDVIETGLTLLVCGSAMGNVSAHKKAYYAHPHNRFWQNLYEVGLTPHLIEPHQYRTLLTYRIGLTDLCKEESGLDRQLSSTAYDIARLDALVRRFQPSMLAFSSMAPAKAFIHGYFGVAKSKVVTGHQPYSVGDTQLFVCSSTSPLYSNQKRTLDLWYEIARWVNGRQ